MNVMFQILVLDYDLPGAINTLAFYPFNDGTTNYRNESDPYAIREHLKLRGYKFTILQQPSHDLNGILFDNNLKIGASQTDKAGSSISLFCN